MTPPVEPMRITLSVGTCPKCGRRNPMPPKWSAGTEGFCKCGWSGDLVALNSRPIEFEERTAPAAEPYEQEICVMTCPQCGHRQPEPDGGTESYAKIDCFFGSSVPARD